MRTKLHAAYVVGYDGSDHLIYQDGDVVYEGDEIVFVGQGYDGSADLEEDAGQAIVGPGFIDLDALADIDHAILDAWAGGTRAAGLLWSRSYLEEGPRAVFSANEERFIRRYALLQLIANGITTAMPIASELHKTWAETAEELEALAETALELGLRMYLGPSFRSGITVAESDGGAAVAWDERLGEGGLDAAIEFARRIDGWGRGLLRGALLPCRIENCRPELLRRAKQAADALACPLRIHAGQSLAERRLLDAWYGRGPIELLADIGFLGERTLIPHAVFLGGHSRVPAEARDELRLLAGSGTTVINCPLIAGRYGIAHESFTRYQRAGVNQALGTDTFPPDMIRAMDQAVTLGKVVDGERTAPTAADLYRAATLGGAAALGREDLGRLAPGARADINTIDLSPFRLGPVGDPIATLLFNASGANVRSVVVNGRTIMRDGAVQDVEVVELRSTAQRLFEKMKAGYSRRDYLQRPPEELFPPAFKMVPSC